MAVVTDLLCWGLLLVVYRPAREVQEVRQLRPIQDPWTWKQHYVVLISVLTVALWCFNSKLQQYMGEMGVIAILPVVAFFGAGILSKDDVGRFLWDVVLLAMGGLALGECVKSSGGA